MSKAGYRPSRRSEDGAKYTGRRCRRCRRLRWYELLRMSIQVRFIDMALKKTHQIESEVLVSEYVRRLLNCQPLGFAQSLAPG